MLLMVTALACGHVAEGTEPDPGGHSAADAGGFGMGGSDPIELEPAARDALEDAGVMMGQGRFEQARKAYLQVAQSFEDARPQAEAMAGAALCRAGQHKDAMAELEAVGTDEDIDAGVRRGALGYMAICAADNGMLEQGLDALADHYPGQQPSALWLEGDRAKAQILLGQARQRQGQLGAMLEALSWAYELAAPTERAFVRALALDGARAGADAQVLTALVDAQQDDFLKALSGAALLLEALVRPDDVVVSLDDMTRIHQAIAAPLVRLDEGALAEELSRRLNDLGGPSPVRIGVLLPLTGRSRRVGSMALAGVMLAQEALTERAGRSTVILADTASSRSGARAGVEALLEAGVSVIIGPLDNAQAKAAAQLATEAEVPMIALSTDQELAQTSAWVFRHFIDSQAEVKALMMQAKAAKAQRVAILLPKGAPFSRQLTDMAKAHADKLGLKVVLEEEYDPGSADFRNQAKRLRRSGAQAVFVPDVASRVRIILPSLAAEQLWCAAPEALEEGGEGDRRPLLCLGNVMWADEALLSDGDTYARSAIIAASYSPRAVSENNQAFAQSHAVQIDGDPSIFAAFAYDATRVARELILARGHRRPDALQEALLGLRDFPGLLGPLSVGDHGELGAPPVLLTVRNGDFAPLVVDSEAP